MAQTNKTMTVSEFKFWLEGVEEMQSDGWSPDKRQWDRIREKINQLETTQATPVAQVPSVAYREPVDPNRPIQYANSGLQHIAAQPTNNPLLASSEGPTASPIRTPNIDSSNGKYDPAFI